MQLQARFCQYFGKAELVQSEPVVETDKLAKAVPWILQWS